MPHQRLLLKLKAHDIGDAIIDWIEQWLTERRQRVIVDGEFFECISTLIARGPISGSLSRIGIRPIPVWDISDIGIGWRVAAHNWNSKMGTRNRNMYQRIPILHCPKL